MGEEQKQITRYQIARNTKNTHSYSPATKKLVDLSLSYKEFLYDAVRSGKDAIWYFGGVNYPLFYGCGIIPAFYIDIYSTENNGGAAVAREKFQIPQEFCGMAQAILGEFYLAQKDMPIKKNFYVGHGCEPLTQVFQYLERYGIENYIAEGGYRPTDDDPVRLVEYKKAMKKEFDSLIHWMIGKPIDKSRLWEEQHRFNRIQTKVRKMIELRKQHTTYFKSVPMMMMLAGNGSFFGRPDEYEEMLDMLIDELSALKSGEYNEAKAKFAWAGMRGALNTVNAIDEANGAIVDWYTPNNYTWKYDETIDPLEAAIQVTVGDEFYMGTTEEKCITIAEQINRSGAKGLFLYGALGCSFGSIEIELQRQYFQKLNVPTLAIADTFTEGSTSGQLDTRIRAFVEMFS